MQFNFFNFLRVQFSGFDILFKIFHVFKNTDFFFKGWVAAEGMDRVGGGCYSLRKNLGSRLSLELSMRSSPRFLRRDTWTVLCSALYPHPTHPNP